MFEKIPAVHPGILPAIRAVPGFPKYVPDSESYHKSYYLTILMDSTLDCYESEVAAVADLPRSTAELIFIQQPAPPTFQIESMQLAPAAIALLVDAACGRFGGKSLKPPR